MDSKNALERLWFYLGQSYEVSHERDVYWIKSHRTLAVLNTAKCLLQIDGEKVFLSKKETKEAKLMFVTHFKNNKDV